MEQLKIKQNDSKERIDTYLTNNTSHSRNYIQNLIKDGYIKINNKLVKANYILKVGDLISISEPKQEEANLSPANLNLEVIYEDEYLAVINKPKGLVVHPSDSYTGVTLINGLIYQFKTLSNQAEPFRQGIIHRLDKDTSGLMIIGKDEEAHQKLKRMFQLRKIEKRYIAIVYNEFKEYQGTINKPIVRHPKLRQQMTTSLSGRSALTEYKVINQNNGFAYIEVNLITGRTHQIRVHMKSIHHPILGDPIYGPKKVYGTTGPFLHASKLSFTHPITKKRLDFEIEPSIEFINELIKRQLSE